MVPTTTVERVYITLLMVISTCLFSRIIGDMHDILQFATQEEAEVARQMDGVVSFLRINRVPTALQQRIRAWISFKLSRDRADARLQEVLGMLSQDLRHGVAASINSSLFSRVPLLQQIQDPLDRAQFAAALLPHLRLVCFPRGATVADHRTPADKLIVELEGRLSLNLPAGRFDTTQESLHVLKQGDSLGEASVIADSLLSLFRPCRHPSKQNHYHFQK